MILFTQLPDGDWSITHFQDLWRVEQATRPYWRMLRDEGGEVAWWPIAFLPIPIPLRARQFIGANSPFRDAPKLSKFAVLLEQDTPVAYVLAEGP